MFASVTVKIQPIPLEHLRFVAFSDASFASEKVPDSHQGMLIMASHKDICVNKNSPVNPIVWHSKKIQKVGAVHFQQKRCRWQEQWTFCHGSDCTGLGCEMGNAIGNWPMKPSCVCLQRLQRYLLPKKNLITIPHLTQTSWNKSTSRIKTSSQPIANHFLTSSIDMLHRHAKSSEPKFKQKLIKEHLSNGIMIRWVPSQAQLADALTKCMDASVLRECMERGPYSLHDEAQILRARSDSRARLQWLRMMSSDSKGDGNSIFHDGKTKSSIQWEVLRCFLFVVCCVQYIQQGKRIILTELRADASRTK